MGFRQSLVGKEGTGCDGFSVPLSTFHPPQPFFSNPAAVYAAELLEYRMQSPNRCLR